MKGFLKKLTIFAAVAVIAASTSLAYAMPGEEGPKGEKHGMKDREKVLDQLELSQDQKDQLKAYRETKEEGTKELRKELKANRETLHEELKKYDSDKNVINKTVDKINDLQGKFLKEKTESFLKMKEVLTPEQFQKMSELKDAQREKNREKVKDKVKNEKFGNKFKKNRGF